MAAMAHPQMIRKFGAKDSLAKVNSHLTSNLNSV